ncbi:MAG: hypothetical protein ACLFS3_02950 [Candidatus Aenigmatarchaeota archaeon]
MSFGFGPDLRQLDLQIASEYQTQIEKTHRVLSCYGLDETQIKNVLKKGTEIDRGFQKKYKPDFLGKLKRKLNLTPYADTTFGFLQEKTAPAKGSVLNNVKRSYELNKDGFDEFDSTIEKYKNGGEPEPSYSVCYSQEIRPSEDIASDSEIMMEKYIRELGEELSRNDLGDGTTYFMLVPREERSQGTNNSIEEARDNAAELLQSSDFNYWVVSPRSMESLLSGPVWKGNGIDDMKKVSKTIEKIEDSLAYWDSEYRKGNESAEKLLENVGQYCVMNPDEYQKARLMAERPKQFPREAGEITDEILDLPCEDLSPRSFEKRIEDIMLQHQDGLRI